MAKKNGTEGAAATTGTGAGNTGKPMTKVEAVRRAIADKGRDIKPLQICDYVKEKFNIDISPDVASNYKKAELKGKRKKKKGRAAADKQHAAAAQETVAAARPQSRAVKESLAGCTVEDIRTLRELVDRFGPAAVRSLIDVIAK
jgi:hypothetical protein